MPSYGLFSKPDFVKFAVEAVRVSRNFKVCVLLAQKTLKISQNLAGRFPNLS